MGFICQFYTPIQNININSAENTLKYSMQLYKECPSESVQIKICIYQCINLNIVMTHSNTRIHIYHTCNTQTLMQTAKDLNMKVTL